MTKTQIAKRRNKALNIAVIVIDTIVAVRVLFNFAMTLNNNWDDIRAQVLMVLVSAAMVALFLALLNNMKYKGHPSYVLASVVVLGLAAFFLIYVLLAVSFKGLAGI
ncbi:hypothetical protein J5500_01095 [Candidatus Saccharibacteria bacterium]|nr:hypothetical protein [Candidatus Saccharibacteria bacterium]